VKNVKFLGITFVAVPAIGKLDHNACNGCVFNEEGFDCISVEPNCWEDKSIYLFNADAMRLTQADMVAKQLLGENE